MRHVAILVFLMGFLFLSAISSADIYSWIDGNGVRHFSNIQPTQPIEEVGRANELKFDEKAYTERLRKEADQDETHAEKKTEEDSSKPARMKPGPAFNGKVEMYSSTHCGYCTMARNFFQQHNIRFEEYYIDLSEEASRKFRELNGHGVPLIFIGDQRIVGFNEAAIRKVLGMR